MALAVAIGAWAGVVVATSRRPPTPDEPSTAASNADAPAIVDRLGVPNGPLCEGDLPGDQLERGDATLRVRLRGDTDEVPIEARARLWRLGVAENAAWTAGDELRATLFVPKDGVVVDRLPQGRYRLEYADRRIGAEDPSEFVLSIGMNERTVGVPNRRWFRLRLRLSDETGAPIVRSVRESAGGGSSHTWAPLRCEPAPLWAMPRRPKDPNAAQLPEYEVGGSAGDGFGGPPGTVVEAAQDGFFDLGRHHEGSQWSHEDWSFTFRTDSRDSVRVDADDAIGVDTTFVAVATRIDVLVAHVTNPDGAPLDPSTATIEATSRAVRCPWTPPPDAWRTVPVHVKIVKPGCEPLEFDWTAATADAPHRIVPLPPNSRR